ncbi:hypothetical protein F511_28411 [Dorcoceras hygrometricum]|uniref:Uncharacterized protein n=1 Tax=Dorcoceras hygrometricum TaxID=472368 RepID=A0A2Z7BM71_9LAMI|nr:hypothetical protein F511_28411 [Dorcoceras hygrometricum]
MARMFKTLEDTGLKGFLEASNSVYESAVVELFANAKVIVGTIIGFVANRKLALMKETFAEAFGLTTEGLTSFQDIPSQTVVEMREINHSAHGGYDPSREMRVRYYRSPSHPGGRSTLLGLSLLQSACAKYNSKVKTYTGKSVYAPIEIREINWVTYFLPKIDPADKGKRVLPYLDRPNPVEEHYLLVIQDIRDKAECQLQVYDQWHRFRNDYRLSKILSLKTVEDFVKAENKLFSWGKTKKVSELLQIRDLVWYNLVELHMREVVAEHWKEFHKDKPSANQDFMEIFLLEA